MKTRIKLVKGSGHDCADGAGCLFEWFNYLTRQVSTDSRPADVSPVLHTFGMRLNDALPNDKRQLLARYLPNGSSPLAGTYQDGKDETRGYIALDWLIRTYTPAWLDLATLTAEAAALRDLRRIADVAAAQAAGPVVRNSRGKAAAAGAAAGDAAVAAAGDAARAAARDAAGDAARDAARAAARDAAGDAAVAAAVAAARAAARDAAEAAAVAAARAAARAAAEAAAVAAARAAARAAAEAAAVAAARAAARDAVAPTVALLQDSAIALYDVLIAGEWPGAA